MPVATHNGINSFQPSAREVIEEATEAGTVAVEEVVEVETMVGAFAAS